MRVPIPSEVGGGVLDLRDHGEGQVAVQTDSDGQRYVDVAESTAQRIRREWDAIGYDYPEPGDESDVPDEPERSDICGYEKDDGTRCQRTAGWGRDADTGPCSDHYDAEAD